MSGKLLRSQVNEADDDVDAHLGGGDSGKEDSD